MMVQRLMNPVCRTLGGQGKMLQRLSNVILTLDCAMGLPPDVCFLDRWSKT